jgi:hypothetical protein
MAAKKPMPRMTSGPRAGQVVPKKYRGLKPGQFALPPGRYPDNTIGRARNALARVAQNGTPAQQATVKAKVAKKYPGIAVGGKKPMRKGK